MTLKEKQLRFYAKMIRELDCTSLSSVDANASVAHQNARKIFVDILDVNGYELTQQYRLVKKQ